MRPHTELQKEAIRLRKKGLSYSEIQHHVKVAKSSLSLWLKDVKLKPEHRERLYTKKIQFLNLGSRSQKERREREVNEIISLAEQDISIPLDNDVYRLMGAALYWAEGSKTGLCQITNSDPHVIAFMVRWIRDMFNINAEVLKAHLNIYPQQEDDQIKFFWSDLTGIPMSRFGKSFIKPLNKGYKKNNLYYGTIKITIPKSVDIKHRIFGWVKAAMKDKTSAKVSLVQRKWLSLEQINRPIPVNLLKINPP